MEEVGKGLGWHFPSWMILPFFCTKQDEEEEKDFEHFCIVTSFNFCPFQTITQNGQKCSKLFSSSSCSSCLVQKKGKIIQLRKSKRRRRTLVVIVCERINWLIFGIPSSILVQILLCKILIFKIMLSTHKNGPLSLRLRLELVVEILYFKYETYLWNWLPEEICIKL
jgi:hypothetical protein